MTKKLAGLMNKEQLKKLALKWVKKSKRLSELPFDDLDYSYADALEECGLELLKKIGEENFCHCKYCQLSRTN